MRTKRHQQRDKEQNEENKVRKRALFPQHITYSPLRWTEHRNTLLSISLMTQRREAGETEAVFLGEKLLSRNNNSAVEIAKTQFRKHFEKSLK